MYRWTNLRSSSVTQHRLDGAKIRKTSRKILKKLGVVHQMFLYSVSDSKITIDVKCACLAGSAGILNVPLEEFEEFKSHSLSVRTPSGRKMDLKQAPVRGLGTPNGGIVVFDKTSGEAMNIMPKSSAHVTLRCQDE